MTLRSHLVVLVLVALLPVVLFSLVVVVMLATQERAATDVGLQAMTRSVAAAVDSLLRDSVTSLGTLAAAEHLEDGDVPAFYRMCLRMLPSHPGWSGVALVDASGRAAFSTHRPLGEPLPDAGDRDHIRRALATGRPFVSGHVVGTVTGEPQVEVALPVRRGESVRWVLLATLRLDALATILAEHRMPREWSASIVDAEGIVLARAPETAGLVGRPAAGPAAEVDGSARIATPDGVVHAVATRSQLTDWTVAVALPAALVDASTDRFLGTVLAGGAFFTLLGVALAALLGRRIAAPIVALARSAARHGEGAAAAAASSVDEVRALERELTAASAARTQGEAEREQLLAREQEARAAAEVARQRADVLAEVSRLLASPLDHDAALGSVARLLVPQLADLCAVDLVATTDGALQRVATVAADPDAAARTAALLVAAGDDDHPVARALASGRAELVTPGDGATAADITALVVPLVARGRALGAISLVTTRAGRSYTRADVLLAEDIARRAAAAVDTARLFLQSETRRRAAEALAHAGRFLGEALDPSLVAERIAASARSLLGLATAVLYTVDPQTLEMRVVAASGDVRPGLERGSLLPAGAGTVGLAVRERRPVATADALHDPRLRIPLTLRAALEGGPSRAVLAVPMLAQGQVVGVLAVGDRGSRVFEEEEILFAQGFADQAALAVENARLLAEAQEASRAKDEFLATLSHELRTPLTAMLGWVRMLESGRLDDATVERAIQVIDRNTKLQAQLIDDLLDVSRIVTGKLTLDPRPVNLVGVIESALEAVDQGAQVKGVRLAARLDPSVGPVWGDARRLQQVIWNLLSNAIKFTPAEGLVEVTLERADPCARVRVQDTGSGIKPEFLPHVFDRFRQGDGSSTRPHGGLGIGLALVRDLVGLHRGTVGGHSDGEGLGATFVVELPLMAVRVPDPAPAEGPVPSGPSIERFPVLTGVRVLVVDDDADARELLAVVLEQSGAEVTCAASASEALDALARVRPSVLLSDLAMPDDDGYALVHKLRDLGLDRGGRVRAVAVSAYARDEDRARALAAGFETHVPKPVEPATLIALVARLAGREPT